MTYHYVYKTTNLINGKIYIGVHKTKNLLDNYYGSGKILLAAIEKYGIENFMVDILAFTDTPEQAYLLESIIVDQNFVEREDTYNIKTGGYGGFDYVNTLPQTKKIQQEFGDKWGEYARDNQLGIFALSEEECRLNAQKGGLAALEAGVGIFAPESQERAIMASKTPEARAKQKEKYKEICHQQGEKNSQYGTVWITHPFDHTIKKAIKKEHINDYYDQGWYLTRKREPYKIAS